ncbi:hypothetical protein CCM_08966 [Cordyceps militaris CM01]|uniref:RING-type domain-containing protein n=1 Tax=Cordyceps militaris (strain CM01) TaxID=983644 RepID=G3JSS3_CORMM|nr:uncharacterized protein CCM_08966 [Cordyceps militaris CM01]EGX88919.1 hypothetical protein CCM_08966 [Cordyceps militaris CM01]
MVFKRRDTKIQAALRHTTYIIEPDPSLPVTNTQKSSSPRPCPLHGEYSGTMPHRDEGDGKKEEKDEGFNNPFDGKFKWGDKWWEDERWEDYLGGADNWHSDVKVKEWIEFIYKMSNLKKDTEGEQRDCVGGCGRVCQRWERVQCICPHDYCGECMARILKVHMREGLRIPLRCCGVNIPLRRIVCVVPPHDSDVVAFCERQRKHSDAQFALPTVKCHRKRCRRSVPPALIIGDTATCSYCGKDTCVKCKKAWHSGKCSS